jgi:predicted CXXCH cytochrome family protein
MQFVSSRVHRVMIALVVVAAGAACVDEKVVFRDRELFTEPPPGAADFVGYTDQQTKLTVCGNCHVNNQGEWTGTKHADAFATLVASGHAAAACEGCHAISSKGNATSGSVGWDATKDTRYHDVQCESCHGPGLAHVSNPQATNIPLAPMVVDTGLTRGCGECHSGTHHPFVEEWRQSPHGGAVRTAPVGRAECEVCHVGESVLAAWGVKSNFVEKDSLTRNASASMNIACGVCHDPHAKTGDGQLRFPIDVPDETVNLCMKCHQRRGQPDLTRASSGPHSPEGPTLLGTAGWFPPAIQLPPGSIVATHGSENNPRLCAGCHVLRFTVTDPATGNFQFQATGHLFDPIPCINAQGLPTRNPTCAVTARTFKSCAASGCHTEASARGAFVAAEGRVALLANALNTVIAKIPAAEFNNNDNKYTTGEGAKFNLALVQAPGAIIHNPFLIEALATASIKQIQTDYGITAPPGVVLDNILQKSRSVK